MVPMAATATAAPTTMAPASPSAMVAAASMNIVAVMVSSATMVAVPAIAAMHSVTAVPAVVSIGAMAAAVPAPASPEEAAMDIEAAPEVRMAKTAPAGHFKGRATPIGRGKAHVHAIDDVGVGKRQQIPAPETAGIASEAKVDVRVGAAQIHAEESAPVKDAGAQAEMHADIGPRHALQAQVGDQTRITLRAAGHVEDHGQFLIGNALLFKTQDLVRRGLVIGRNAVKVILLILGGQGGHRISAVH